MREDFLHYIWRFKLLNTCNLKTVSNQEIEIINFGVYTQSQGPDFFNALLKIDGQLWAGNIEMHVKSSDWYIHHHEIDSNYKNVILHVVWEHDVDVFYSNDTKIPVLVLKNYISEQLITSYKNIFSNNHYIPCQNQIDQIPIYIWDFYKQRLFFERLEFKTQRIENINEVLNSNWEQLAFVSLCRGFGLNTNGDIFEQMALAIPFSVFLKIRTDLNQLEALFFGMLNMLPNDPISDYEIDLVQKFNYLKHKFKLSTLPHSPTYYKHRPDNFPTIRLAQLAMLLHSTTHIFDAIRQCKSIDDFYRIFTVSPSVYWQNHFSFQSIQSFKIKKTSKAFINLLIINTVAPLLYSYNKSINNQNIDDFIYFFEFLPPEKNNTIIFFDKLQVPVKSAFDSQVLLQLKKYYCDTKQCLHCAIGKYLIK